MNKRGADQMVWVVIVIILSLVFLLTGIAYSTGAFKKFNTNLNNFQACDGLVGTLGSGEGYCSAQKDCSDVQKNHAKNGYYYQYVGQGWGCNDVVDPTTQQTVPSGCCIQLPTNTNPPTLQQTTNAKAQSAIDNPLVEVHYLLGSPAFDPVKENDHINIDVGIRGISVATKYSNKDKITCKTSIDAITGTGTQTFSDAAGHMDVNGCDNQILFENNLPQYESGNSYVKYTITTTVQENGAPKQIYVQESPGGTASSGPVPAFKATIITGIYKERCSNTNVQAGNYCNTALAQGKLNGVIVPTTGGKYNGKAFICTIDRSTGVCTLCLSGQTTCTADNLP